MQIMHFSQIFIIFNFLKGPLLSSLIVIRKNKNSVFITTQKEKLLKARFKQIAVWLKIQTSLLPFDFMLHSSCMINNSPLQIS